MSKQLKTFIGMAHVKDDYAATGLSDTAFAELISKRPNQGHTLTFSCAEVRSYRAALDIPTNKPRDHRDAEIEKLKELCVSMMAESSALSADLVRRYDALIGGTK